MIHSLPFSGKKIETLKVDLPLGLLIRGTINILGFNLTAEIVVDLPNLLKVDVEMAPITIGKGLIKLRRNANDEGKGPKLYVEISKEKVRYILIKTNLHVFSLRLSFSFTT